MGKKACIAGVGMTDFSRQSGRSTRQLALEATQAALADSGLRKSQIDGIVPFPMGPTAEDLMGVLGLDDVRFTAVPHLGGASTVAGLGLAALAVESGRADYVVVFIARNGRSDQRIDSRVRELAGQMYRVNLEYAQGMNTPAQWYSLIARRHMHEFGTSREALGTVALTMRENSQRNPHAQMYGRPLTMQQYLESPMIADPYKMFDCCLETDGAGAVIVTTQERAADLRHAPVMIDAVAEGHPRPADDIANRDDFFATGLTTAAPRAFAEAGLTPGDIDVALIYDCFTFELIQQLEEAGFCARGEGGPFVLDGHIAADGSIPVNPHGGLLSEGHIAGMNHIVEAVTQLRGDAGDRQVSAARTAFLTGWGDLGDGTAAILSAS